MTMTTEILQDLNGKFQNNTFIDTEVSTSDKANYLEIYTGIINFNSKTEANEKFLEDNENSLLLELENETKNGFITKEYHTIADKTAFDFKTTLCDKVKTESPNTSFESEENYNSTYEPSFSPNQTRSRYGRHRKPKISEDFYNTEDIFGPYERISSPKRKQKKSKVDSNDSSSNELIKVEDSIQLQNCLSSLVNVKTNRKTKANVSNSSDDSTSRNISNKKYKKKSKKSKKSQNLEEQEEKIHIKEETDEDDKIKIYYNGTDPTNFNVGTLTWCRIGSHPFWPAIITNEPNKDYFYRKIQVGKRPHFTYHVHFFGDNGRRCWVTDTHIFPFYQRSDLEVMGRNVSRSVKRKDPTHESAFIVPPHHLKTWEKAVTEAESLTNIKTNIRVEKFCELTFPTKKRQKLIPVKNEIKIKFLIKNKKNKKKKLLSESANQKLQKKKKLSEDKEKKPLVIKKVIKKRESSIENIKPIITTNESMNLDITDVSIKSESKSDALSPELQLQRQKRINLLKGVSRDRVCQICFKNQEVHRCKGCFALYHIDCDKNIKQKLASRLSEEKSSIANNSDVSSYKNIPESNNQSKFKTLKMNSKKKRKLSLQKYATRNSNKNLFNDVTDSSDISCNETFSLKENNKPSLDSDKHENVNYILNVVLEKVFNITENKITSELEEKIENVQSTSKDISVYQLLDEKLEAIMQPLLSTNEYAESATDEGNESEEVEESFVNSNVMNNSTQSEQTINYELVLDPLKPVSEFIDGKVKKKIIKHVTADGSFDIIEEEIEPKTFIFKCTYCSTGIQPPCFACNKEYSRTDKKLHRCITAQCGKYYHQSCLKDQRQAKWNVNAKNLENAKENLYCPYHNCQTCANIYDDPHTRYINDKLVKCLRCPTAYHPSNYCIPAGTLILSAYQIICPKHNEDSDILRDYFSSSSRSYSKVSFDNLKERKQATVNTSWCVICSSGGSLICCDSCPNSFHVECLNIEGVISDEKYICGECETGLLPLYDEIVWVKFGCYRWWPARIIFPAEVPPNVMQEPHWIGDFVVKYFATNNYSWVNRRIVYLFNEKDTNPYRSNKTVVQKLYIEAFVEAKEAHKKFLEERANRDFLIKIKPPRFTKIKVNQFHKNLRSSNADTSHTTPCDCDPNLEFPCSPDSDCLNRYLLTECNPLVCAAGKRCCNQSFEKREYQSVEPFKTSNRGWGLKTLVSIKKGTFVIEYVGEIIDEKEYTKRMNLKHSHKDEDYYFLSINKDRIIDAGPKGNDARFMNHSCSPNCQTQKWKVNGDTRVGLFALTDIPEGAELTFNYNLECIGEEKKECRCGAPNCSGFIGAKAKQEENTKRKSSLPTTKKKIVMPTRKTKLQTNCFICGNSNAMQLCDQKSCNKFYHLKCVTSNCLREGKWICPCHHCKICSKRTTRSCYMCINAYCAKHSNGNISYDHNKGFICTKHNIVEERTSVKVNSIKSEDETINNKYKKKSSKLKLETKIKNKLNLMKKKKIKEEIKSPLSIKKTQEVTSDDDFLPNKHKKSNENRDKQKKDDLHKTKMNLSKINTLKNSIEINSSEVDNNLNKNNTIKIKEKNNYSETVPKKKRKSRLSLLTISQADSSDEDKPLINLKKSKLSSENITEEIQTAIMTTENSETLIRSGRTLSPLSAAVNSERKSVSPTNIKSRRNSISPVNTKSKQNLLSPTNTNLETQKKLLTTKLNSENNSILPISSSISPKNVSNTPTEEKYEKEQNLNNITKITEEKIIVEHSTKINYELGECISDTTNTNQILPKPIISNTIDEHRIKTNLKSSGPEDKNTSDNLDNYKTEENLKNVDINVQNVSRTPTLKKSKVYRHGTRRSQRLCKTSPIVENNIDVDINLHKNNQIMKANEVKLIPPEINNSGVVVKRKRGRPRKVLITTNNFNLTPPTTIDGTEDDIKKTEVNTLNSNEKNDEKKTEIIKVSKVNINSYDAIKNNFNHVRVVLKKSLEIDRKMKYKFLAMQNDIEKNLPIRKRSLRYESQLETL